MSFTVKRICVKVCYATKETYDFLKLIFKDEKLWRSTALVTYVLKTVENRGKTTIVLAVRPRRWWKSQRCQHCRAVRSRIVATRNSRISVGLSFRTWLKMWACSVSPQDSFKVFSRLSKMRTDWICRSFATGWSGREFNAMNYGWWNVGLRASTKRVFSVSRTGYSKKLHVYLYVQIIFILLHIPC
jgi:hypothetical protein